MTGATLELEPRSAGGQQPAVTRLGVVRYVNTRPLIAGLESLQGLRLRPEVPAQLIGTLERGETHAALCSSVDFQMSSLDLVVLPVGVIGCDGPTLTVQVFSRVPFEHPAIPILAERIVKAKRNGRAIILLCGAHVLRAGNAPLLIDLMQRGLLTHIGFNGAGAIHDFELAMIGQTCESVAKYVKEGQFGLWQETSRLNDAVTAGYRDGLGFGEAVGRTIENEQFPFRETSIFAASIASSCRASRGFATMRNSRAPPLDTIRLIRSTSA